MQRQLLGKLRIFAALPTRPKITYMFSSTFFQQRPYAKAGLLAIPLIICMLVMGQHFPKGEVAGYKSKIIAFEFVKDEADVRTVLDALNAEELRGMDRGNYIDFAFMLCYGVFISFFFLLAYRQLAAKWLQVGVLLGLIVFLGDLMENIQLLNITRAYTSDPTQMNIGVFISQLQWFTWIKWIGLGIALAMAAIVLRQQGVAWRWIGWGFFIPFVLSIVAFAIQTPAWIERYTSSIFLGLGGLILSCFFIRRS